MFRQSRNKLIIVVVLVLSIISLGFILGFFYFGRKMEKGTASAELAVTSSAPYIYFSKLDGLGVRAQELEIPRAVGIMIDNHPDAHPQSGLSKAPVVYEAPVEGGITRYMAVFDNSQEVQKVGPVRSARPYFLDWLSEYGDALYMHVGGSPEALGLIKDRGIFDRDEFFWGSYYWRSKDRFAPYNVYTKNEHWQTLWSKKIKNKEWEGWKFGAKNSTSSARMATGAAIQYMPNYVVEWKYSSSTGKFYRFVNNRPHQDPETAEQFQANTVIIQKAVVTTVDSYGRRHIKTIGSGEAVVFRRGVVLEGTWKKEKLDQRTRFYDADGKEIVFAPGQTWVQVIPVDLKLEIRN